MKRKSIVKSVIALGVVVAMLTSDGLYPIIKNTSSSDNGNIVNAETVENTADKENINSSDTVVDNKGNAARPGTKLDELEPDNDVAIEEIKDIDFEAIVEQSKDEAFRDEVAVKEDTFVVIREENEDSASVEDEEWYGRYGITEYSVLAEHETEDGEKRVTYVLTTTEENIWSVVDGINESGKVVIAEPEYTYYIASEGVPSEETNEGMSSQWYLDELSMKDIWTNSEGDATGTGTIVAVIDTGVDYTHEDLKDNMWMNTAELLGQEGVDDDNNGYKDDIYGVSFIDGSSNPMDDNGHGTHVAGIIAMDDNETGGVGIAYNAQIMAIKAGGADGTFSSTDIAKAINYAANNGADVINMSFGSYARSAIMEEALQNAFSTCVLVAAAGNDSYPTQDALQYMLKGNMYPASYTYVIGVMAHDSANQLADFSNWDYKPNANAEYEMTAPGKYIYSTLPGDRYASWSGTSMATPMVAAAAAILRSNYPDKNEYSSRYIMGQLVSATEDITYFKEFYGNEYKYSKLNVNDSMTKAPTPNIYVEEVYIFDSVDISDVNNGDGIVQPGETIDIAVGYRNQWGAATEFYATVNATSTGGIENPYVTFTNGYEVLLNDIGTFASQNNGYIYDENDTVVGVSNPIRVKISEDAPNDANISFYINYHAKNAMDSDDATVYRQMIDSVFTVSVQKGKVLSGKITESMTLSNDEYYIIENSLLIPRGVTVNVEAGTKIQFWSADSATVYGDANIAYIDVQGVMNFNGTEEEPIELFTGKDYEAYEVKITTDLNNKSSQVNMSYVKIINPNITINKGDHLELIQNYDSVLTRDYDSNGVPYTAEAYINIYAEEMSDSKIKYIRHSWNPPCLVGKFDTVLFDNCYFQNSSMDNEFINCTFLVNQAEMTNPYTGEYYYVTAGMREAGEMYFSPQYYSSDIYEYNGKKYVIYDFSSYWYGAIYSAVEISYKDYKVLLSQIEKNGGTIANLNPYSEEELEIIRTLGEYIGIEEYSYILTGQYYDWDLNEMCSTNGNTEAYADKNNPFVVLYTYDSEEYWYQSSSYLYNYVIAEYPDTVSDYTVQNPALDADVIIDDLAQSNKFKNNAILNRLMDKDISNWMKFTSSYGNSTSFYVGQNYWGTVDETLIQKQLVDFNTNIRFADYVTAPQLEAPSETTYPCVSDIYVVNSDGEKTNTVGNGTIEVHVLFNRDMDTSVLPMVTYGPDDPYTDYLVNGEFINAREWVGTVEVKVLINQGQQYFRVVGAVAADDAWLTTGKDWGRFGFMIEATGAEALTLQAEGLKGQVHLMWTQDDYDTLAGYNVYRSDSGEEGTYKKVNSSVISLDVKEYGDTKVQAGKKYYYYFTVVDTALNESKPSNIVICASIDDVAPVIKVKEAESYTLGINGNVTASITDNVGVNSAVLYYRMEGEATYKSVQMVCTSESSYSAQILAKDMQLGNLEYYIMAADSNNFAYAGSADEPYTVEIKADARVLSVQCDELEVGETATAVVNGINLTEGMEVYVGKVKADVTYVSDKELDITFTADYMGMKTVELVKDGVTVARLSGAVTVVDDSVEIYNEPITVIEDYPHRTFTMYFDSNYQGIIETMEITYYSCSYNNYGRWMYPCISYRSSSSEWDTELQADRHTYKLYGDEFEGGRLFYCDLNCPNSLDTLEIFSVKINGVEVKNVSYDASLITYIAEDDYVELEEIIPAETSITVEYGETFEVDYSVYPTTATFKNNVYTYTYDSNLVKNEDGTYTAIGSGSATIYISSEGITESVYVYINPVPATDIVVEKEVYTGIVGQKLTMLIDLEPVESDEQVLWYYGSNSHLITCLGYDDNGHKKYWRLDGEGTATVSVETASGLRKEFTIIILPNEAYIELEEEIVTCKPNQTKELTYEIMNKGDSDIEVEWTSSNPLVATVSDNGVITSKSVGFTVITTRVAGSEYVDSVMVFVGSDSATYTLGDINDDGKISSTDAMIALKLIGSGECDDTILKIADVNVDGVLTSSDAMLILQYATGKIKEF